MTVSTATHLADDSAEREPPLERGLTSAQARSRRERYGPNAVTEERAQPVRLFLTKFWGLSAWMLELIVALSAVLHKTSDAVVALALLVVNAVIGFAEEQRASAAVEALKQRLAINARVLRDGSWQKLPGSELVPGDVVRLRAGDFVPADVKLVTGELRIDESALTGEALEHARASGGTVYSGAVVHHGEATAFVTATGTRTYFGRTAELVRTARPKLRIEAVVSKIVRWLFLLVGALLCLAVPLAAVRGLPMSEVLPLALVLLMSAVPVALPVMFTVSTAIGALELGKKGVLVTRLSAAEDAATMTVLCVDKTGTITQNRLAIVEVAPRAGFQPNDVVRFGALASQEADQDPIDLAFLRAAKERSLPLDLPQVAFVPFDAATRRTEATVEEKGARLHVLKGAVSVLAEACALSAADKDALEKDAQAASARGYRTLAVAAGALEEPPRLVGLALLYDAPRPDSRALVEALRGLGVSVKMLTGDALPAARTIATAVGLGQIARNAAGVDLTAVDGLAEVYPEDKFKVVKALQAGGAVVGMTGDGVNDAPALRQAEVGIAVSSATDIAKGAASVVLTTEGLTGIASVVDNGRRVYQRILAWIVNKISRTIMKASFVTIAFIVTGRFVISAFAMVMLVFMTDFVKVALSTDHMQGSPKPDTWNIRRPIGVAALLGVMMTLEALGLLAFGWHRLELGAHPEHLQTFSFATLLFFALFSIVSIREKRAFWRSAPSRVLALALVSDGLAGLALSAIGLPGLPRLSPATVAVVVAVSAFFCLGVNDWVKRRLLGTGAVV